MYQVMVSYKLCGVYIRNYKPYGSRDCIVNLIFNYIGTIIKI